MDKETRTPNDDRRSEHQEDGRWCLVFLISLFPFIGGFIYSLQAPFYPIEAQSKGVSVTVIAFVFAIYELMSFVMSLVTATALARMGPVAGLHLGILLTGLCTVGMGLASFINDRIAFVAISVIFRLGQSVGAAFRAISTLSLGTFAFPETMATMVASIESISRVGSCLGLTAGGALMQVSGFRTTFILSGAVVIGILPVSWIMLRKFAHTKPPAHAHHNEHIAIDEVGPTVPTKSKIELWTLLCEPSIALPTFLVVTSSGCQGFAMAVMEPNLQQFNPTPFQIGLVFMCPFLAYLLTSMPLGYLYDKLKSRPVALFQVQYVAPVLLLVAFTLLGPVPFAPFRPSMALTAVGLTTVGIAVGSASSSSFLIAVLNGKKLRVVTEAENAGAAELRVHELISGIWRAAISLGMFVAPGVSGLLYDAIGFRNQCLVIVGLQCLSILLITAYGCMRRKEST